MIEPTLACAAKRNARRQGGFALMAAIFLLVILSVAGGVALRISSMQLAGLGTGCAVTILFNLMPALQWQGIHPGIWGLLANVPVQVVVSLLTPAMDESHVNQFVVQ